MNPASGTLKVILRKNKLRDIRFHELRHSCASLLLAKGIPMKMIYGQQLGIGGDLSMKYYVMGYAPAFNSKSPEGDLRVHQATVRFGTMNHIVLMIESKATPTVKVGDKSFDVDLHEENSNYYVSVLHGVSATDFGKPLRYQPKLDR